MCKAHSLNFYQFLISILFFLCIPEVEAQCSQDEQLETWLSAHRYKLAMDYTSKKLPKNDKSKQHPCSTYYLIKASYIQNKLGNVPKGKWLAQQALLHLSGSKDSTLIMDALTMEAYSNHSLGNLTEALTSIVKVLKYANNHKNAVLEHKSVALLAGIELHYGRMELVKSYYQRAVELADSIPLPEHQASNLMSYALALTELGEKDKGKILLDKSLRLAIQSQDTITQAIIELMESNRMLTENPSSLWQEKNKKVIDLATAIGHERLLSMAYGQLLEYYIKLKNYDQAIKMGGQALKNIEGQQIPIVEAYLDSLMFVLYREKGEDSQALSYFEKFYQNQKIILNQELFILLNDQSYKFQSKQNALTIEHQKSLLDKARTQKILLILLIVCLLVLMTWSIVQRWLTARRRAELYQKEKMMESIMEEGKNQAAHTNPKIDKITIPEQSDSITQLQELDSINEDRTDLYQELLQLIESQKLYLNPQLDQKLIIMLLGTNRTYLYQAISTNGKSNFKNIINMYRVREVKKHIEQSVQRGTEYYPEQIYSEAGFNSLASYYRIFKQFTGLTPKEYMQEYARDLRL